MTSRITPGVGANLLGQHAAERNQDATAYVGNLDAQVTSFLYPLVSFIPYFRSFLLIYSLHLDFFLGLCGFSRRFHR